MSESNKEPLYHFTDFKTGDSVEEDAANLHVAAVELLFTVCQRNGIDPAVHLTRDELIYAKLQDVIRRHTARTAGNDLLEAVVPPRWDEPFDASKAVIITSFPLEGEYFKNPNGTPPFVIKENTTPKDIASIVKEEI